MGNLAWSIANVCFFNESWGGSVFVFCLFILFYFSFNCWQWDFWLLSKCEVILWIRKWDFFTLLLICPLDFWFLISFFLFGLVIQISLPTLLLARVSIDTNSLTLSNTHTHTHALTHTHYCFPKEGQGAIQLRINVAVEVDRTRLNTMLSYLKNSTMTK